eukprot:scaffold6848_cov195-Skeletonema_marinoi.AAC.2
MNTEEAASYSSASSNSNSRRMMMSSSKLLLNPVAVLLGLILSKDWKMIRTLIAATSPDCFRDLADSISSCSQHKLNGMTLLHAIVRDNPPLIVANIIKLCPEMAAARDGLGRTPLHIAAGSKAPPLLLKAIASAYPAACDAQDEDGRTPLHFVCDTSFVLFADNEDADPSSTPQDQKAPKHEAILKAIMCGASLMTVKLLQASATKSLRSRVRSASPNPDPQPGTNKRRRVSSAHEDGSNSSKNLQGIRINAAA